MIARKIIDTLGISIYTDFPLSADMEHAMKFLTNLEVLEGVEKIEVGKYHIEVSIGLLFDTHKVSSEICALFEDFFEVVVQDIDMTFVVNKMSQAKNNIRNMINVFTASQELPEA